MRSVRKVFLEISHYSQENTCARISFEIKLLDSGRISVKRNYFFRNLGNITCNHIIMLVLENLLPDSFSGNSIEGI